MPPIFQPVKTTKSILDTTSIVDGKAYFVQDSEQLFFDYDNVRTEIRDIIVLDTEAARTSLLAPLNKFYFVVETAILWLYRNGTWTQVAGGSNGGISLKSQSFSSAENINSVTLDEEVSSASSIVSVNIDNASLLKSAYMLEDDLKTITFAETVTSELGIDVIYAVEPNTNSLTTASVLNSEVAVLTTTKSRSILSSVEKDLVLTAGNVYQLELTGHTNLSFGSWSENGEDRVTLYLSVPDAYMLTLPASIKWKNGLTPNLEVNGLYILEFRSIDKGTTIFGSIDKYI